jgi:hypothetical protein
VPRKPPPEKLDLDEIENDFGFRGMVEAMLPTHRPLTSAPSLGAPTLSAPTLGAPDLGIFKEVKPKLHQLRSAQDGHTNGEQAVYATMYRMAVPIAGSQNRILTAGARTIASQVPMAYSNAWLNMRSLEKKLAIRCEGQLSQKVDGKTYTVFSYADIMERRSHAGLTHCIKTKGGVEICSGAPNLGAPVFAKSSSLGAPNLGSSGAPRQGAYIGKEFRKKGKGAVVQQMPSLPPKPTAEALAYLRKTIEDPEASERDREIARESLERAGQPIPKGSGDSIDPA